MYRALQLLNKLASGRMHRSDAQPQIDNVDVWGTRDDSAASTTNHAVFITNFNVSCDATPLPARSLNLTLLLPPSCTPSALTMYTLDDVNGRGLGFGLLRLFGSSAVVPAFHRRV